MITKIGGEWHSRLIRKRIRLGVKALLWKIFLETQDRVRISVRTIEVPVYVILFDLQFY